MSSLLLISGDMAFSCGERVKAGQKSQLRCGECFLILVAHPMPRVVGE
jgi:hypothetical protein